MACSPPTFAFSVHGSAGNYSLQIDATNVPLFCENEFTQTATVVQGYGSGWTGARFNPADGLHGPPPLVNFFSNWRISVPITDAQQAAGTAGVRISGAGPNSTTVYCLPLPTATAQTATVIANTALPITLSSSLPAIDCPSTSGNSCLPTYAVTVSPTNGTITGTAPNLLYTPNAGYTGTDSFTFSATGCGSATTATVSITVKANVATPPGGCL